MKGDWEDELIEWTVESVKDDGFDMTFVLRRESPGLGQVWKTVIVGYSELGTHLMEIRGERG